MGILKLTLPEDGDEVVSTPVGLWPSP